MHQRIGNPKRILVLVLILCALLMTPLFYNPGAHGMAKAARAEADIESIAPIIETYRKQNRCYPSTAQGLWALVAFPAGEGKPAHWVQMMESLPVDPWGNRYQYLAPGKHNPQSFDLYLDGGGQVRERGNWQDPWWVPLLHPFKG